MLSEAIYCSWNFQHADLGFCQLVTKRKPSPKVREEKQTLAQFKMSPIMLLSHRKRPQLPM